MLILQVKVLTGAVEGPTITVTILKIIFKMLDVMGHVSI